MEQPTVKNVVIYGEKKIMFNVMAYRQLTAYEATASVRIAVAGMKKKPKAKDSYTIYTLYSANE